MVDGMSVPLEVQIAATSIKFYTAYKSSLQKRSLSAPKVRTKLSLGETKNGNGDIFSIVEFKQLGTLADEPDPQATYGAVCAQVEATSASLILMKARAVKYQQEEVTAF